MVSNINAKAFMKKNNIPDVRICTRLSQNHRTCVVAFAHDVSIILTLTDSISFYDMTSPTETETVLRDLTASRIYSCVEFVTPLFVDGL
jgi:ABC-type antimicrobial peptide transport system ATPase subunit